MHLEMQDVVNNTKTSALNITKIKGAKNIEEFSQAAKESSLL